MEINPIYLLSKTAFNKAHTGQAGFGGIFEHFAGSQAPPVHWRKPLGIIDSLIGNETWV
jgi:hypothetical protein